VLRRISRALIRRCPNCGQRGVFKSWGTMVDQCPTCLLTYEREEGYWLGAVLINTTFTIGLFAAVMITWALASWPDPPWTAMTATGIVINLVVPLVFYPVSKTLWVALETTLHPPAPVAD
jgi:uncharacterized protein (DUF983 family)